MDLHLEMRSPDIPLLLPPFRYNDHTLHIHVRCECCLQIWGGVMRKNPNLFTIGEVAQAVGVTRRILLHYEECGLVQPDVKDGPTGNRYYSIDTFVKIRTIRIFQNLGLSLNEIRGYFDDSVDLL